MGEADGGPAFPVPGMQQNEEFNGMALRDYFAAQAMQGYCAGILADGGDWPNREIVAANAFAMADAMLSARSK